MTPKRADGTSDLSMLRKKLGTSFCWMGLASPARPTQCTDNSPSGARARFHRQRSKRHCSRIKRSWCPSLSILLLIPRTLRLRLALRPTPLCMLRLREACRACRVMRVVLTRPHTHTHRRGTAGRWRARRATCPSLRWRIWTTTLRRRTWTPISTSSRTTPPQRIIRTATLPPSPSSAPSTALDPALSPSSSSSLTSLLAQLGAMGMRTMLKKIQLKIN